MALPLAYKSYRTPQNTQSLEMFMRSQKAVLLINDDCGWEKIKLRVQILLLKSFQFPRK